MTHVTGTRKERTTVITDEEFREMLDKTREPIANYPQYYMMRDRAILCIFRLTGKRVSEVARLKQEDLAIKEGMLSITFTVSKKRKKQKITVRREKAIPLTDPLVASILEYKEWMQQNIGDQIEWLFPRTHFSPHFETLTFGFRHLTTRQLHRIVQKYNPEVWPHLFRETVGADIVRADRSIMAVWKVKKRLDLTKTETAWRYMDRYGLDIIERRKE